MTSYKPKKVKFLPFKVNKKLSLFVYTIPISEGGWVVKIKLVFTSKSTESTN